MKDVENGVDENFDVVCANDDHDVIMVTPMQKYPDLYPPIIALLMVKTLEIK